MRSLKNLQQLRLLSNCTSLKLPVLQQKKSFLHFIAAITVMDFFLVNWPPKLIFHEAASCFTWIRCSEFSILTCWLVHASFFLESPILKSSTRTNPLRELNCILNFEVFRLIPAPTLTAEKLKAFRRSVEWIQSRNDHDIRDWRVKRWYIRSIH